MKKNKNALWDLLSSVKLTLFTLFILAVTSIIGTVIPQNEPMAKYVELYGDTTARFFQVLDIPDMYNSWWFLSLLTLLSLNLIVCTFTRLPDVWRLVVMNNLEIDLKRLERMPQRKIFMTSATVEICRQAARTIMGQGGKPQEGEIDGGTLIFQQKGAWTRLGVYAVHCSVLVIFVGAIIGSVFGYKGFVMIPEGSTIDKVFNRGTQQPEDLGFIIKCDLFSLSYYKNGTPKEYRSELSVYENGEHILSKSIVVNDPLDYRGHTFYQASYQPVENELFVRLGNDSTDNAQGFRVGIKQEVKWEQEGVTFGILNYEGPDPRGQYRFKVWFNDGKGEPSTFWAPMERPIKIERPSTTYSFLLKQRYATGLQVAKDPGVWWVYAGCTIMLLGIVVTFFLSHRRIWIYITKEEEQTRILVSGTSNKNKIGFEKEFDHLLAKFTQDANLHLTKDEI